MALEPIGSSTAPPAPAPGSGKMRKVLVASLVLNVLLIGMAVGGAVGQWRGMHDEEGRDIAFGPFTDALSQHDRIELRRALIKRMPDLRSLRGGVKEDLAGLIAVLRAEPFDVSALQAAFGKLRSRIDDRMGMGQDLLVTRISEMSSEERTAFADRLEARLNSPRGLR